MATETIIWNGNEDLRPFLVPLENIELLPGNYRDGDIPATAASFKRFGQRSTISGDLDEDADPKNPSGTTLAGNTRVKAAMELGWTHIAISWSQDEDPREAAGFALADNRTHDLGGNDPIRLAEWIEHEIGVDDGSDILEAAGYDLLDIEDVLATAVEAAIPDDDDGNFTGGGGGGLPVIQTNIVFDDEDQQQIWFTFVRWLKSTQDGDTVAARLTDYLRTILPEDD